ncbi:MAG: hypothetical protein FJ125_16125, partial [Deltaproteobacteria bacterium]|nr:hypothetical protein [Deltaproteobacteria bacterium]
MAAALRAGIAVVTRWTDHRLLETPEIRKTLRESCWTVVPDSGSGPRRTATELGTIRLEAMPRPEAEEPTGCRPVEVRIVVTRYRVSREEARGCGVTIDGWQYELFATTVRADDWPAAELVELYYGRAGQENRFLQIDAELGKLRLITTHLPGMELLVAAGLFLSNWRLQQGAAAARWCPGPEVSQPPRKVETVPPDPTILPVGFEAPSLEQTVAGSAKHDVAPAEPPVDLGTSGISGQAVSTEAPTEVPSPAMAILAAESEVRAPELKPAADVAAIANDELPSPSRESLATLPAAPTVSGNIALSNEPGSQQVAVLPGSRASDRSRSLMAVLLPLLWLYKDLILRHHPGWSWRPEPGAFFCPSGEPALPICATTTRHGRDLLVLRVAPVACRACGIRSGCTKSEAWGWGRELRLKSLNTPGADAPSLCCRQTEITPPAASRCAQPDTTRPLRPSPAASRWSPPTHAAPGPHQASAPSLVPAHLRRCASEILGGCRVTVELPSTRRPLPRRQPWSALTAAERQHRRHTYGERIDARHRPV